MTAEQWVDKAPNGLDNIHWVNWVKAIQTEARGELRPGEVQSLRDETARVQRVLGAIREIAHDHDRGITP